MALNIHQLDIGRGLPPSRLIFKPSPPPSKCCSCIFLNELCCRKHRHVSWLFTLTWGSRSKHLHAWRRSSDVGHLCIPWTHGHTTYTHACTQTYTHARTQTHTHTHRHTHTPQNVNWLLKHEHITATFTSHQLFTYITWFHRNTVEWDI